MNHFDQIANIQLIDPENDQFLTSIRFPFILQEYLVLMSRFNEDLSMFIVRVLADVSFKNFTENNDLMLFIFFRLILVGLHLTLLKLIFNSVFINFLIV